MSVEHKQRKDIEKTDIISTNSPAQLAHQLSDGFWDSASHLEFLDQLLIRLDCREFSKLIINMPPRHGKSEFLSVWLPVWHLHKYPNKKIMFCTYSNQFAATWGRRVKQILKDKSELLNISLSRDSSSGSSFLLDGFRGGMHSTGAGSSVTGRGADLLIIDDPIKNSSEANSPIQRNKLWDWFNTTAMTRLEPNAAAILLMTRWHQDDICGRLIEAGHVETLKDIHNCIPTGNKWLKITLPAIAGQNDPLCRKSGEALWPERYTANDLNAIKKNMGVYWFEAMYQQSPVSEKDSIFNKKDFRYFTERNDFYVLRNSLNQDNVIYKPDCRIMVAADIAISTKESADYTAAIVFAITPDYKILILDVYRLRVNGTAILQLFESIQQRWKPRITGIESVQFQNIIIDQLRKSGLNIKSLKPQGMDKRTRAQGIALRLQNHSVFFPSSAMWLQDFEKELMQFPNSPHDDQCDAFAYIDFMIDRQSTAMPIGRRLRGDITKDFW